MGAGHRRFGGARGGVRPPVGGPRPPRGPRGPFGGEAGGAGGRAARASRGGCDRGDAGPGGGGRGRADRGRGVGGRDPGRGAGEQRGDRHVRPGRGDRRGLQPRCGDGERGGGRRSGAAVPAGHGRARIRGGGERGVDGGIPGPAVHVAVCGDEGVRGELQPGAVGRDEGHGRAGAGGVPGAGGHRFPDRERHQVRRAAPRLAAGRPGEDRGAVAACAGPRQGLRGAGLEELARGAPAPAPPAAAHDPAHRPRAAALRGLPAALTFSR